MELQVLLNHFSAHVSADDKLDRDTFFNSLSQGGCMHGVQLYGGRHAA